MKSFRQGRHWIEYKGSQLGVNDIIIEPGFHKSVTIGFTAPQININQRKLFLVLKSMMEGEKKSLPGENPGNNSYR